LHKGQRSNKIVIKRGVKQGCILSPTLFNIALDYVMEKVCRGRGGITWGLTRRLEDLDYADDICLLSHNIQDARRKIEILRGEAAKVGLKINIKKTKEIRINAPNEEPLHLLDEEIERVEKFEYLGSIV